jgi:hypothetical protein
MSSSLDLSSIKARWNEVLDSLLAKDRIVWLAFFDARLVSFEGSNLSINFTDSQKFGGQHDFSMARNPKHIVVLQESFHEVFGITPTISEV